MTRKRWTSTSALAAFGVAVLVAGLSGAPSDPPQWGAHYFPNVALTTQDGEEIHFYDFIKGKIVAIDLIFTSCEYSCPLETARLAQIQKLLGDRVGKDVFFISITIDPEHDTPKVLKAYAEKYHAGPGWLFLTGKDADIDLLSKRLGLYSDPDPAIKDRHMPSLLIGNEETGQWIRANALDNAQFTATLIGDWMNSYQTASAGKSYAEAQPLQPPGKGQYMFSTMCATCHSIGGGDKVGPDLAGITAKRESGWLNRYITGPDLMRDDPIAKTLFEKYNKVLMPNLNVSPDEAQDIIDYVNVQTIRK